MTGPSKAQPFTIAVPDAVLTDLRQRLDRTRWPSEVVNSDWAYGADLAYVRQLADYWRTRYDWRAQERALNRFPQFRATVNGLGLHFIHQRGQGPRPLPLLLLHGWPGSIVEFTKIIPLLADPAASGADPADAFDIIAPSLPGYGFSDIPTQPGINVVRVADLMHGLMTAVLGYRRYAVQGGDWGAVITSRMGFAYPQHLAGIHVNMLGIAPHPANRQDLSTAEQAWLKDSGRWRQEEVGYQEIQGTKPQTLAYGLTDSPVGLAAWIVEKFRAWSDCGGDVERRFTKDELLTNVMVYWVTGTINSACRLYYENRHHPWRLGPGERIAAPTGVAAFREMSRPPREWAARAYNLQHWTDMPGGGHFAAMEEPALLSQDVRAFFRPLR